jgi:uncharacterized protein
MNNYLIRIFCATGFLLSSPLWAASFDCSKASNQYEKTICANPNLSSLDDQLAIAYKNARDKSKDPEALKKTQIDWIKATRQCADDTFCIEKAYRGRIAVLVGGPQTQQPTTQAAPQTQPPVVRNTATQTQSQQTPTVKNQSVKSGKDAGYCFVSIQKKSQRNMRISDEMVDFFNANLPIYRKIGALENGKCKGLGGTSANEPCFRANLSPDEFDWYVGMSSAYLLINGPQDPNKLPMIEIISAMCIGLVK